MQTGNYQLKSIFEINNSIYLRVRIRQVRFKNGSPNTTGVKENMGFDREEGV